MCNWSIVWIKIGDWVKKIWSLKIRDNGRPGEGHCASNTGHHVLYGTGGNPRSIPSVELDFPVNVIKIVLSLTTVLRCWSCVYRGHTANWQVSANKIEYFDKLSICRKVGSDFTAISLHEVDYPWHETCYSVFHRSNVLENINSGHRLIQLWRQTVSLEVSASISPSSQRKRRQTILVHISTTECLVYCKTTSEVRLLRCLLHWRQHPTSAQFDSKTEEAHFYALLKRWLKEASSS